MILILSILMDSSFSLTNIAAAINLVTLLCAIFFFFYRKFRFHQENKTVASSSSILSTPSSLPRNWKHHVFPSFHGEDVRKAFLSHFLKEFRSKGIDPFIHNSIERSKSIGPELIEAIRGSRIAIVLLSKNYASSTWCLDELVEIIRCREVLGQTVMVLFYEVDPTDIKKQTGDFGKVFRNTCKGKTEEDIRRWKHALAEVAKIAGYHSKNCDNEAEMIEKIASDVSKKLSNSTLSSDFDSLVGMESHMINFGPLLQLHSEEVRIIGILGPSGIGKTTIARVLFNRHSKDFQLSVFMENIRARYPISVFSDDYSVKKYLQEQFMSQLINEESFKIPHLGIVKDRLKDKKVFVILDDVDRLVQLEAMAKEACWFGPWSRIIITTQNKKLLKASGVNHIYRVGFPSSDEALQMFCMYAFGQNSPKDGFRELACQVTSLAGKLPLGLRIMGSYFRGMSKQDWIKALPRLKTRLNGEIESILKYSYDALCDEDKTLFLHIACFFNNEPADKVESYLANSFMDVTQGLCVLTEKSLISMDWGMIQMHNLLVQLGREIVRKQCVSEPGKRQFLDDTRDLDEVLSDDNADGKSVIGIIIMVSKDIITSKRAFERLSNLQFIRIEGEGINLRSMNSISRKLRFLKWDKFPLPCFPSDFHPKFLVKLDMQYSNLEKPWEGIQPLDNLKWMDLSSSKSLKELPDLSTATSLCELNLAGCSSLVKLPTSIGNAINLQKLCINHGLSLVELPSSVGNATNLQKLNLSYYSRLIELPSSIGNAIKLQKIVLAGCSNLVSLPNSIGKLINLEKLDLGSCTSLLKLPSSIGNIINLQKLILYHCSSLVELPSSMKNLHRLWKLDLEKCSKLEVVLTNINLESLTELDLSHCSLLKCYHETSTNIEDLKPRRTAMKKVSSSVMSRLFSLQLRKTYCELEELGPWIGRVSGLRRLVLSGMQNLVSLPQLPYSIEELNAESCESLEIIDCSFRNPDIRLDFTNCFKLNQEARHLVIHTPTNRCAVLPGGEVPACFTYRAFGSFLTVKLKQKPLRTPTKFKACIILSNVYEFGVGGTVKVYCSITSRENVLASSSKTLEFVDLEHLYTFEVEADEVTSELVFYFSLYSGLYKNKLEIKECGILQLREVPSCGEHYKRFRDEEEQAEPWEPKVNLPD